MRFEILRDISEAETFATGSHAAEKHGVVRIIDEPGDDYLYPKTFFRPIALPQSVKKAVLAVA